MKVAETETTKQVLTGRSLSKEIKKVVAIKTPTWYDREVAENGGETQKSERSSRKEIEKVVANKLLKCYNN
ncbi:hypothetical protein SN16_03675 [Salinicoccus roseus]|uniref:Uncharacterized protein n=2 Tax=Salinicoccus roseus TaxID=45670 RepID=A0A0C2DMA1_9STAP|nr:hypothetical protein SN16_03675 [Salinicoccus roseus]